MRLRKQDLRTSVKGEPPLEFSDEPLSAHAGLELVRRYLRSLDLPARLRATLRSHGVETDYGVVGMVFAVLALILLGGQRASHLAALGSDPLVLRFCGLQRLPSDRTLTRWMKRFGDTALLALRGLVRDLVHDQIEQLRLTRITVDLDGTVLRTGDQVERAARGFHPHHPKDCSYYPLTAHVAELGQIPAVWNRPGNVHDSHGAAGFLRTELRDLRQRFGRRLRICVRMDGAFFVPEVLRFLDGEADVGWAVKVPLWRWLNVRQLIIRQRIWTRVSDQIDGFSTALCFSKEGWPAALRVVVYRKRVRRTSKQFQLSFLDPADGVYEYSAIATNLDLDARHLWQFMAGRGAHEKTLAELRDQCAFAAIPSNDFHANSAWQLLSAMALNLSRSFQIQIGAAPRKRTRKRTFAFVFKSLRTLGFELLHHPARLVRPQGQLRVRVSAAAPTRRRIRRALESLSRPSRPPPAAQTGAT